MRGSYPLRRPVPVGFTVCGRVGSNAREVAADVAEPDPAGDALGRVERLDASNMTLRERWTYWIYANLGEVTHSDKVVRVGSVDPNLAESQGQ
jgi:hypothetical protein